MKTALSAFHISGYVTLGAGTQRAKIMIEETLRAESEDDAKRHIVNRLACDFFNAASDEVLKPVWRAVVTRMREDEVMRTLSMPMLPGF
jgi:hypothetical protein